MTLVTRGAVLRWLDSVNRRHPWSHNDHFHGWLRRRLPDRRGSALDVGCGRGDWVAALADRFDQVDAVDPDAEMTRWCQARFTANPRVRVRQLTFDEVTVDPTGGYDLITMIAALHHMDLYDGLRHARALLRPGGRLLVVGVARADNRIDRTWDLVSVAANPVFGLIKHPRAERDPRALPPYPISDPVLSFGEIAVAAGRMLPGARLRRRLFFRYTLDWTRPD